MLQRELQSGPEGPALGSSLVPRVDGEVAHGREKLPG